MLQGRLTSIHFMRKKRPDSVQLSVIQTTTPRVGIASTTYAVANSVATAQNGLGVLVLGLTRRCAQA